MPEATGIWHCFEFTIIVPYVCHCQRYDGCSKRVDPDILTHVRSG